MEEINRFLRLLKKHRLILIIVPAITVIITFFLVRNLPNSYVSQTQIATGIVDDTQSSLTGDAAAKSWSEVSQAFANLMEVMRLKKILDQVSYKLIIHEISGKKSFRAIPPELQNYNQQELKQILNTFEDKYNKTEGLNLWDAKQIKLYNILRAIGYDSESIKNKIKINRVGDSDFITVEVDTENPELSAFIVNSLTEEFIKYYTFLIKQNQRKANTFLDKMLIEKRAAMNSNVNALRDYKIKNRVLNLEEQSSQLYAQIITYNDQKQSILKDIAANTGAVNEIDGRFDPKDRKYLESTLTRLNQRLLSTKEELRSLYDLYIQNNFEPSYKESIDSLQRILTSQINQSSDQYINSPLATKQALIQQKLQLEVQLDLSRYSMNSIENELLNLNAQFDKMVPHEAEVQSLEREVEISSKEYLDALEKFNQSSMESGFAIKINQVQIAMPGLPQPSKKMLLVIISGIVTFIFCLVVLFILYFLDDTISSSKELANKTGVPVLGGLNTIQGSVVDLNEIWNSSSSGSLNEFKDQLRSIRFEIDNEIKNGVIAITSMKEFEGKTLLALSLAHAWKMTNKKVLIIDGNFTNPEISRSLDTSMYIEDYLNGTTEVNQLHTDQSVTVLANKGADTSPLEIADAETITSKINQLKELFDVIIIETASLSKMNQSKEWLSFAGNVIAVFEARQSLNDEKLNDIAYLTSLGDKFTGWVFNKQETFLYVRKKKKSIKNG
ncbi:hypothetical protein ADIARSV_1860 [Arcticibacter svalbardensis MN12-7]|uniref:Lipopolysaccharide biosynthesis protein n=1 Tax=Arcticibacter svalbardensis MN12-7 TaxID=1150600 RepID=R9H180_9SPHI|nr:hypothetical protein [Arcticibacter svalbardensis]EOR94989.1 hypothetical protein ADIARSV_1860 [Arcticibacter svalbardensis MN12-7]